jgi:MFS transporter, MCT family, aspergillic acid transporter
MQQPPLPVPIYQYSASNNHTSLVGRLSAGILSDKIGTYNVLVSACYFAGILSLALWIPATGNAGIIVFAILFGLASGAYIALAAALVVCICPFKEIGYRTGLLFLVASLSGLATSPIGGAIIHLEGGSYTGMQIFSGATLLLGSSFVLAARFSKTGLVLWTRF